MRTKNKGTYSNGKGLIHCSTVTSHAGTRVSSNSGSVARVETHEIYRRSDYCHLDSSLPHNAMQGRQYCTAEAPKVHRVEMDISETSLYRTVVNVPAVSRTISATRGSVTIYNLQSTFYNLPARASALFNMPTSSDQGKAPLVRLDLSCPLDIP